MRSGRLRHRVLLQSKTYTANAYGEQEVTWSTVATVWAGIEPLSGRELFAQQQIQAEARVRIVLRYYSGLDTTWRVRHDGKNYDILEVINQDLRDASLVLLCREGVSEDQATAGDSALLLETGDALLLESGDRLLLEA